MNVTCDVCHHPNQFDDHKIGPNGLHTRCTQCGHSLFVMPPMGDATDNTEKTSPGFLVAARPASPDTTLELSDADIDAALAPVIPDAVSLPLANTPREGLRGAPKKDLGVGKKRPNADKLLTPRQPGRDEDGFWRPSAARALSEVLKEEDGGFAAMDHIALPHATPKGRPGVEGPAAIVPMLDQLSGAGSAPASSLGASWAVPSMRARGKRPRWQRIALWVGGACAIIGCGVLAAVLAWRASESQDTGAAIATAPAASGSAADSASTGRLGHSATGHGPSGDLPVIQDLGMSEDSMPLTSSDQKPTDDATSHDGSATGSNATTVLPGDDKEEKSTAHRENIGQSVQSAVHGLKRVRDPHAVRGSDGSSQTGHSGGLGQGNTQRDKARKEDAEQTPSKSELTRDDIVRGVKENANSVIPCVTAARQRGELPAGTYTITLNWVIRPSGLVHKAKMTGPAELMGTSLPACAESAVDTWQFPASVEGAPIRNYPFGPFTVH